MAGLWLEYVEEKETDQTQRGKTDSKAAGRCDTATLLVPL